LPICCYCLVYYVCLHVVNQTIFFTPRHQSQLRGHACYTNSDVSALIDAIFSAFELLVCGNSLPAETTDFFGLDKFNNSISNMFLLKCCLVNFEWISPCDTEVYCTFYVITCITVLFLWLLSLNCFITLLQHVRGQSALCCQIYVCMYVCVCVCVYVCMYIMHYISEKSSDFDDI